MNNLSSSFYDTGYIFFNKNTELDNLVLSSERSYLNKIKYRYIGFYHRVSKHSPNYECYYLDRLMIDDDKLIKSDVNNLVSDMNIDLISVKSVKDINSSNVEINFRLAISKLITLISEQKLLIDESIMELFNYRTSKARNISQVRNVPQTPCTILMKLYECLNTDINHGDTFQQLGISTISRLELYSKLINDNQSASSDISNILDDCLYLRKVEHVSLSSIRSESSTNFKNQDHRDGFYKLAKNIIDI